MYKIFKNNEKVLQHTMWRAFVRGPTAPQFEKHRYRQYDEIK